MKFHCLAQRTLLVKKNLGKMKINVLSCSTAVKSRPDSWLEACPDKVNGEFSQESLLLTTAECGNW